MAKQQQRDPRDGGGSRDQGDGAPHGRGHNRPRGGRNKHKSSSRSPARNGRSPVTGKQKEKNARLSSYESAQQTKVDIPLKTGMTIEQLKELTRKRLAAQSYSPPPPSMRIAQKVTQPKAPKTDEPVATIVQQSDPVYPPGYVAPEGVRTRRRQRNARSLGPPEPGMRSTAKEWVPNQMMNDNGSSQTQGGWQLSFEPDSPLPHWGSSRDTSGADESLTETAALSSLLQGLGSPSTVKRKLHEDKGPFDNSSVYHLSIGKAFARDAAASVAASALLRPPKPEGDGAEDTWNGAKGKTEWSGAQGKTSQLDMHLNKLELTRNANNASVQQVARSDSLGDVRPIIEDTASPSRSLCFTRREIDLRPRVSRWIRRDTADLSLPAAA